jgi:hypothetical protein
MRRLATAYTDTHSPKYRHQRGKREDALSPVLLTRSLTKRLELRHAGMTLPAYGTVAPRRVQPLS